MDAPFGKGNLVMAGELGYQQLHEAGVLAGMLPAPAEKVDGVGG